MGIDGVGKPSPARVVPGEAGPSGVSPTAPKPGEFVVSRSADAPAASPTEGVRGVANVAATNPLARLRAGEIDLDRYLDLKVDEATAGLKGLAAEDREEIRRALRDQIATDPALTDLVQFATGELPRPPED